MARLTQEAPTSKTPAAIIATTDAGIQPVQTLALIQCSVEERESEAEIHKTTPARPLIVQRLPRDSKINAGHHRPVRELRRSRKSNARRDARYTSLPA